MISAKDRSLQIVAFLLLGVFSFILYSGTYEYVLVWERGTPNAFFLFDRQFLRDFLSTPGGFTMYAWRFFEQFYEYTASGALVVAALITGLGVLLHGVLKRRLGGASLFFALLPCVALATTPNFRIVDLTVGLIASVGSFVIYQRLPEGAARRIYALLAMPALYLLAGGCFWLFAWWVVLTEWLEEKPSASLAWKLFLPALAAGLPVIAWRWLFLVPLRSAFLSPTVFASAWPRPVMLLYGYLALLPLWARVASRARVVSEERSKVGFVAGTGLLMLISVALLWFCSAPTASEFAEYQPLYKQKRWDDILRKAAGNPSPNLMTQFFTNCALAHKGKLLDEMFRYPQTFGTRGLILNFVPSTEPGRAGEDKKGAMYNSDLFFEMGHVNMAIALAFDDIVLRGRTYENVSRMAECSMANEDFGTARKYVTLLERTLFHRSFAGRCERLLADKKAGDEYFAPVRARLPTVELPMTLRNFVPLLTLVESHPENRMAFDYLIAWCLLDEQALPMMPDYLGHLKEAGYAALPVHVQEALLTYENSRGRAVEMPPFAYDPKIEARFSEFVEKVERSPSKPVAQRELGPSFGGTFMYYALFLRPGDPHNYGAVYWRLGNEFQALSMDDEALAHYRNAVLLNPQVPGIHLSLAGLLEKQGKREEAAFEYGEARRTDRSATSVPFKLTPAAPEKIE